MSYILLYYSLLSPSTLFLLFSLKHVPNPWKLSSYPCQMVCRREVVQQCSLWMVLQCLLSVVWEPKCWFLYVLFRMLTWWVHYFVLCFSPLHLSKQHNHQELSFSSFACFHRISNPCGLHGLHSSILQPSKSFDTFSPLFPQTSCYCRVLFSIHKLFNDLSTTFILHHSHDLLFFFQLESLSYDLQGNHLCQTYLQHLHLCPCRNLQFQCHTSNCQHL